MYGGRGFVLGLHSYYYKSCKKTHGALDKIYFNFPCALSFPYIINIDIVRMFCILIILDVMQHKSQEGSIE